MWVMRWCLPIRKGKKGDASLCKKGDASLLISPLKGEKKKWGRFPFQIIPNTSHMPLYVTALMQDAHDFNAVWLYTINQNVRRGQKL
jgi:hypothetical protein